MRYAPLLLVTLAACGGGSNDSNDPSSNGDGTTGRKPKVVVPQRPLAFRDAIDVDCDQAQLGDFNGDATLDFVCSQLHSDDSNYDVWLLLGNGDGTFQNKDVSTSFWMIPHVYDANRDGRDDLVVEHLPYLQVYTSRQDGRFDEQDTPELSASPKDCADVDGDGRKDFIATTDDEPNKTVTIDFDGNGKNAKATVLGDFVPSVWADVDGDGRADAIDCDDFSLVLRTAKSNWETMSVIWTGTGKPGKLASGDFNGDGSPDLAFVASDTQELVILSAKDNFQPVARRATGFRYTEFVAAADIDGDGFDDIVMHDTDNSRQLFVLRGTPELRLDQSWQIALVESATDPVRFIDMNKDGMLDIVSGSDVYLQK